MDKDQIELKLSKNLRFLIKEKGMTVVTVSRKTGIPLQTLHGWLAGVEPRSITQMKKIANFFSISTDHLCFEKMELPSHQIHNEINSNQKHSLEEKLHICWHLLMPFLK